MFGVCNNPWINKLPDGREVVCRCGHCLGCRIDRRKEWTSRLKHELSTSGEGYFCTLTYDDDNIPDDYSLHKEDVQKFLKRLRKNTGLKLKYYFVGEYGELGSRPHYHGLIFGKFGDVCSFDFCLRSCWRLGFVQSAPMTEATIKYTLKYMDKEPLVGKALIKAYAPFNPPFSLMSKSLGVDWWLSHRDVLDYNGVKAPHGRVSPLPRYYRDKFGISLPVMPGKTENKSIRQLRLEGAHRERMLRKNGGKQRCLDVDTVLNATRFRGLELVEEELDCEN